MSGPILQQSQQQLPLSGVLPTSVQGNLVANTSAPVLNQMSGQLMGQTSFVSSQTSQQPFVGQQTSGQQQVI